jgi:spore coat polysaccharide biosynthesis protein SpsF
LVKVVGVIQARISSNRLPAKVMLDLVGKTILERVIERVKLSNKIDEIWIATSNQKEDDLVENLSKKIGINCFRGNLNNVLERFYEVINISEADIVVRITADNPMTEPRLIDKAVCCILDSDVDYVGFKNVPIGSAVEVFTRKSFMKLAEVEDLTAHNKEHVTSYYYQNPRMFRVTFLTEGLYTETQASIKVTVDTIDDFVKVASIYKIFEEEAVNPLDYLDKALTISLDNKDGV